MKILRYFRPLSPTFLLLLLTHLSFGQEVIEKTFSGIDILEMEIGGVDVIYTGVPGAQEIKLAAMFGKNEDARRTFFMVTVGNTLKVSYKNPDKQPTIQEKRFIHLEGPEKLKISIRNTSGLVGVSKVIAEETLLTVSSGKISADKVNGNLTLKANSGKIEAREITGNVTCSITSGMAEISQVSGNAEINANSGSLKITGIQGLVNAKLSSGNMRLENVGELGRIIVSSGNVKANNCGLGSTTALEGTSGNIDIQTVSQLDQFNYNLKAGSGSLRVGTVLNAKSLLIENGAQHTIKGTISSGSLQIRNM
jgi:lia operon protein LiaG